MRAHGGSKYYYQQRISVASQKFSPLKKGDACESELKSKTPRPEYQDLKSVKNRIFEKNVEENRLTAMFSRRSRTPQITPNLKKKDYLQKCMQPHLDRNNERVVDVGIVGNGRTLVSHSQGEIPNYRKDELRGRDPILTGVKIDKDRKNQLFSSILVETRKMS